MALGRHGAWLLLLGLAGCASSLSRNDIGTAMPTPRVPLSTLPGWAGDHVADAMPALLRGCARLALTPPDQRLGGGGPMAARAGQAGDWSAACAAARAVPPGDEAAARAYLTAEFDAYRLNDPARPDGLFTGYYEPEVQGSREKTYRYRVALMSPPGDLVDQAASDGSHRRGRMLDGRLVAYYTRAEIDAGALRRQRLDLLYLKGPVDLFFLQIQGSGRVDLPNGHEVRVGYAATNGQPYVPIGRAMVERGDLAAADVSAQSIRAWLEAHPREAAATMALNPAYVFFREVPGLSPAAGPLGSLGAQLTPLRSIAVDPGQVPLGAPVWIDTTDGRGGRLSRLMLAQDTGSGVTGAARADIFCGWGADAEAQAGRLQAPGRAWVLLPKSVPLSRTPGAARPPSPDA